MSEQPGLIVLISSGETASSSRKVFDWLFQRLSPPIRVAVLETPAGFELNSDRVAGRVANFLHHRLQNYRPQVTVIPARKRGTPFSPDDPAILEPLLRANVVFMGPGSPTYAVRQLRDSLAWHMLVARHRLGAAIVLASAAAIAAGSHALPVYEIYKVGEDLHWHEGLSFFTPYGLSLVIVTHWNNAEGGPELDTSRCFMGRSRFQQLLEMLPSEAVVLGIDEHTALVMDPAAETCQVMGKGGVTLVQGGKEQRFERGEVFGMGELGEFRCPAPEAGLPAEVWQQVVATHRLAQAEDRPEPSPEVVALVQERAAARARRDWATADALRERIAELGWQVRDTPEGQKLEPLGNR